MCVRAYVCVRERGGERERERRREGEREREKRETDTVVNEAFTVPLEKPGSHTQAHTFFTHISQCLHEKNVKCESEL